MIYSEKQVTISKILSKEGLTEPRRGWINAIAVDKTHTDEDREAVSDRYMELNKKTNNELNKLLEGI